MMAAAGYSIRVQLDWRARWAARPIVVAVLLCRWCRLRRLARRLSVLGARVALTRARYYGASGKLLCVGSFLPSLPREGR